MSLPQNLLPQPPETLLPEQPEADAAVAAAQAGQTPTADAAGHFPSHSAAWALLADEAWSRGSVVESYAYARTGYHRGLDALRRNGWKGHGPVPWKHAPNQGFLRCLSALARAASQIGESDEAARCAGFLRDCDPAAADHI
jgi:hypothetical protein